MDKVYDFSHDKFLYRPLGGSDRKRPVLHDGIIYMLKFAGFHAKRDDMTTSHVNSVISEYIGSHISQSTGLDTQDTVIGTYNGELVVGCKDFRKSGEENYEFSELVHGIYDSGEIKRAIRYDQLYDTIATLPENLRQPSIERYWDTFVIDALIGNFDRHMGNWGYLIGPDEKLKIAPVYDYGSTLLPQLSVKGCKDIINDKFKMLERCLVFPSPALFIGKEKNGKPGYYDVLSSNFDSNCTQALIKMQPKIDISKINIIIDNTPMLPDIKRVFLKKYIGLRKEVIIDRAYEHCIKRQYDKDALQRIRTGHQYSSHDLQQDLNNNRVQPHFEQTEANNRFVMVAGIPGSGKHVYGQNIYDSMPGGAYIRTNNIRDELQIAQSYVDNQKVFEIAFSRICTALKDARDVVYVATNLSFDERLAVLQIMEDIPNVRKELAIMYKDPADANSDEPYEKLYNMAVELHNSHPEQDSLWDSIEINGDDPIAPEQIVELENKEQNNIVVAGRQDR